MPAHQTLIEKLNTLPIDRLAEVEDFVDFLGSRDQARARPRRRGCKRTGLRGCLEQPFRTG